MEHDVSCLNRTCNLPLMTHIPAYQPRAGRQVPFESCRQVVKHHDLAALRQESTNEMTPDKSAAASDENLPRPLWHVSTSQSGHLGFGRTAIDPATLC